MTIPTRLPTLVLSALAAAASAAAPIPVATPTGPVQSCIPIVQIDHSEVRSDNVIDFVMRGRQVFRNTLPSACPELGFEKGFSYKTSLTELCSVDIITVFRQGDPRIPGASCGLGDFQPVTLAR